MYTVIRFTLLNTKELKYDTYVHKLCCCIYISSQQHAHVNNSINNSTRLKTILYFHNLVNISSNAKNVV